MVNIFIQPLHAILYLVFVVTAHKIAELAPVMAIIFLFGLSRGEKIVKDLFSMRGRSSISSIAGYKVGSDLLKNGDIKKEEAKSRKEYEKRMSSEESETEKSRNAYGAEE